MPCPTVDPMQQATLANTGKGKGKRGRKGKKGKKGKREKQEVAKPQKEKQPRKLKKSKSMRLKEMAKSSKQEPADDSTAPKPKSSKAKAARKQKELPAATLAAGSSIATPKAKARSAKAKAAAPKPKPKAKAKAAGRKPVCAQAKVMAEPPSRKWVYQVLPGQLFGCPSCRPIFNGCKGCRKDGYTGKRAAEMLASQTKQLEEPVDGQNID